ncbi:YqaA family protein [Oceanisphaera pacifica]|uniref:VTT domain-containing protein n=1 Tax=Oceanisphaera pacifica TaxID=2818389 RepID=A0ABS3NJ60_9GAMM|nr:VTT domain-containing protein [Oceanisphaera pacifica]MBO1520612.1 VTT domain-containing protein [Oceanisphaera pacifica]
MADVEQQRRALPPWALRAMDSGYLLPALFVASFLEAIIVPIPLELILIPLLLLQPKRRWLLALVALAGCLCGALVGYGVGAWLFDSLGQSALATLGAEQAFAEFKQTLAEQGFMAIVVVGITPVPFQVAMLAAGATQYPIVGYIVATTLARGIRYFGLAMLVALFGQQALSLFKRYGKRLSGSLLFIAVLGYGLYWWLTK